MSDKQRIIDLQKQIRIARTALEHIANGFDSRSHHAIAEQALDDMRPLDRKRPLAGLLNWQEREVRGH